MNFPIKDKDGTLKGIFIAYLILILHVVLLAIAGVVVLLFKGFIYYLPWIIAGCFIFFILLCYLFYVRMRYAKKSLNNVMGLPAFQGRPVEIKLFGGAISITSGQATTQKHIADLNISQQSETLLLENNENHQIKQLTQLAQMLEKDLITRDEYNRAKKTLL